MTETSCNPWEINAEWIIREVNVCFASGMRSIFQRVTIELLSSSPRENGNPGFSLQIITPPKVRSDIGRYYAKSPIDKNLPTRNVCRVGKDPL